MPVQIRPASTSIKGEEEREMKDEKRHENRRQRKLAKLEKRFERVSKVCGLKRARIMRSYENLIKKMERSI